MPLAANECWVRLRREEVVVGRKPCPPRPVCALERKPRPPVGAKGKGELSAAGSIPPGAPVPLAVNAGEELAGRKFSLPETGPASGRDARPSLMVNRGGNLSLRLDTSTSLGESRFGGNNLGEE